MCDRFSCVCVRMYVLAFGGGKNKTNKRKKKKEKKNDFPEGGENKVIVPSDFIRLIIYSAASDLANLFIELAIVTDSIFFLLSF